jgi:phosphoglycolate phosphatase
MSAARDRPRRFELVVFDWDGTLMDSAELITASILAACRDLGLPEPPRERARHIIGLGMKDALEYLLPDLPESRYRELALRYRIHFTRQDAALPLFDGIPALLDELNERGHLIAVATGKSRSGLDRALEHTDSRAWFHATRCADESHPKPHPAMLHDLMDRLGVAPDATLMIGDTTHDLDMATNAGVAALGVTYGAHPRDDLLASRPLALVDDIEGLATWLRSNA